MPDAVTYSVAGVDVSVSLVTAFTLTLLVPLCCHARGDRHLYLGAKCIINFKYQVNIIYIKLK